MSGGGEGWCDHVRGEGDGGGVFEGKRGRGGGGRR